MLGWADSTSVEVLIPALHDDEDWVGGKLRKR